MYAHYFKSSTGHMLILSQSPRPQGEAIAVKGKADARKLAKQHNARPWNF